MDPSTLLFDWNTFNIDENKPSYPIELCDETLRDGIQSPSVVDPSLPNKLRLVELMDAIGIHIANIGLPGAGPRAYQDVAAIARFVRDNHFQLQLNCAARTLIKDIEPIVRIQESTGVPISAYCFLGTSPIRQFVEDWDEAYLFKTADTALRYAVENDLKTAFVTEDTTRSHPDLLTRLFEHAIDIGVERLVLCDTVGHATPTGVANLVKFTRAIIERKNQEVQLDWHGHNDRGLGLINAIAAAYAGCSRIHGTCLGIGERVGNTPIDQLIVNFYLMGLYPHDVSRLADYVHLGSQICHTPIPVNYPLVGKDAFRTATGVHAAAVIKAQRKGDSLLADTIYSGVPASIFGLYQTIEIGHMSGLSNVRYWLEQHGIKPNPTLEQAILDKAKASNKTLTEQEIWGITQNHLET